MSVRPITTTQPLPRQDVLAWGPQALRSRNARNRQLQAEVAQRRPDWIRKNIYYYELLRRLLRHVIEPGKRVLNLRCQTGFFLGALNPCYGVGVDISSEMIDVARRTHPQFTYHEAQLEEYTASESFDYVLLCDVGDIVDVQKALAQDSARLHQPHAPCYLS